MNPSKAPLVNVSSPLILQSLDASGRGIAVEFFKQGDRYAHRVLAIDESCAAPIFESIEGDDQTAWPPSPPLQELSRHGAAILGLGMAGNSHWSLSVELQPDGPGVVFDAACRVSAEPLSLGSSYASLAPLVTQDRFEAVWRPNQRPVRIASEPAGESPAAPVVVSTGGLWVQAPLDDRRAPTIRWKYRIAALRSAPRRL